MEDNYLTNNIRNEIYRIFGRKRNGCFPTTTQMKSYIKSLTLDGYPYILGEEYIKQKYDCHKSYNEFALNQSDVYIVAPNDNLIVRTTYNIAAAMSGISLHLNHTNINTYCQFKLYDTIMRATVLSPIIIITDLPLDSLIITQNKNEDNTCSVSLLELLQNNGP
jgi:hypothetical protein